MIVKNTIQNLLGNFPDLKSLPEFIIDEKEFDEHYTHAKNQHPEENEEELKNRVIYRLITLSSEGAAVQLNNSYLGHLNDIKKQIRKWAIIIILIILSLFFINVKFVHGQNVNTARATAAAPTYAEGDRVPLSTDLAGALRAGVSVSATISTAGLVVPIGAGTSGASAGNLGIAFATTAAPSYTNNTFNAISTDLSGNLRVNATVTPAALQNVNLTQAGSVSVVQCSTAGCASVGIPVLIMNPSGNPVIVNFLTANIAENLTQIAGTATDVNSGNKSNGTLRVVLATDQPQLTNKLLVTPDSVALPANQSVNVNQLAGTTTSVNNGAVDAGTLRVSVANNSTGVLGLNAGTNNIGNVFGATVTVIETTALNATAVTVVGSANTLVWGSCFNPDTANVAYAQIFDAASVTVGTTVNINFMAIPPLETIFEVYNRAHTNSIKVAATTAVNNATNAVTAVHCKWGYRP